MLANNGVPLRAVRYMTRAQAQRFMFFMMNWDENNVPQNEELPIQTMSFVRELAFDGVGSEEISERIILAYCEERAVVAELAYKFGMPSETFEGLTETMNIVELRSAILDYA